MRSRNISDAVIGLVFAGLGVGVIIAASGLRTLPGMAVGSGLFPTITGAGMIFFGLLLLVQAVFFPSPEDLREMETPDGEQQEVGGLRTSTYALLTLAALAVLIIAMPRAGFIATGIVFATVIARMGGARWWGAVLFAILVTLGLYAAFVHGLRVPLPRGLLG